MFVRLLENPHFKISKKQKSDTAVGCIALIF